MDYVLSAQDIAQVHQWYLDLTAYRKFLYSRETDEQMLHRAQHIAHEQSWYGHRNRAVRILFFPATLVSVYRALERQDIYVALFKEARRLANIEIGLVGGTTDQEIVENLQHHRAYFAIDEFGVETMQVVPIAVAGCPPPYRLALRYPTINENDQDVDLPPAYEENLPPPYELA